MSFGSAIANALNAERARAEKAEQERDQFRSQAALFQRGVAGAEQERDALRSELTALKLVIRDVMCDGKPLITVDEDGRVWRVEQVHAAQNDVPIRERYFRLVPIEDAP